MSNNDSNDKNMLHDKIESISGGFSDKIKSFGEKIKNVYINKLYVKPNADPSSKSSDDEK